MYEVTSQNSGGKKLLKIREKFGNTESSHDTSVITGN